MKIERVSAKEMRRRTGLSSALGYTFPEKETILLLEGLSRTEEKKVLAHEEEHLRKGEEGPWLGLAAMAVSAISSKMAADKAAKGIGQQINTLGAAADLAKDVYDTSIDRLKPYEEAGAYGMEQYLQGVKDNNLPKWGGFGLDEFEADPGYQFRKEQGLEALDRMMAKSGKRFSGERGIGLLDYGQRMASQEFAAARERAVQDYGLRRTEGLSRLNQWANLASGGQQAALSMANIGQNYAGLRANLAQSIGGAQANRGAVQAAGIKGVGNAISGGLGGYNYTQGFNNIQGVDISAIEAGMGGAYR